MMTITVVAQIQVVQMRTPICIDADARVYPYCVALTTSLHRCITSRACVKVGDWRLHGQTLLQNSLCKD